MASIMRIEATGPRAVEEVWARYTCPSDWPSWAPQIRTVRGISDPIAAGARGVVHGPLLIRVPFRIVSVDEPARRWTWRVGVGALSVMLDHGVDETAAGSNAWADVHAPRVAVLAYSPLARLALRRLVGG